MKTTPGTFFEQKLTLRSIVGGGGTEKISPEMISAFAPLGGNTPYFVPASPRNLLDGCDNPALAAQLFTNSANHVGAPIYIATLQDCIVSPTGAVVTRDGSLILESLYGHSKDNFLQGFSQDIEERAGDLFLKGGRTVSELEGDTVYNRDVGEYGYFHWINSILPRFSVVPKIPSYGQSRYLMSHKTEFAKSSLPLFGVRADQIVPLMGNYHLCDTLHFLSPWVIAGNHWTRPPEIKVVFEAFKKAVGIADVPPSETIYLSREDAPVRRLSNETAIIPMLKGMGCQVLTTTGMDFREQAELFHKTSTLVSVHGAGLSNLVFMQPGTAVIEILSPDRLWPTFRSLAVRMNVRYAVIAGSRNRGLDSAEKGSMAAGNEDFSVTVPGLEHVLGQMIRGDA